MTGESVVSDLKGRTFPMLYGRIYVLNNDIESCPDIMCPHSYHPPSHFAQCGEIASVSLYSVADLLLPERCELIVPSLEIVPMPEVAINEHTDLSTSEHDIGATGQIPHVLAKPQTSSMQG